MSDMKSARRMRTARDVEPTNRSEGGNLPSSPRRSPANEEASSLPSAWQREAAAPRLKLEPSGLSRASIPSSPNGLRRARWFIDECYAAPLDLEQMARQAQFSRFHFIRAFKEEYGITPHQYLIRRRFEKAKELLSSGGLSVTEVCLAVGFRSLGSFSTRFTQIVGLSPQRYRTQMTARRRFIPNCFLWMAGVEGHPSVI